MSANPPPFTHDQIEQYFDRIHLKKELRNYHIDGLPPKDALAYLALLQKYHLLTVPFENLSLHYSPARRISLHPDELFRKVVGSRGRGGYCMELNALFGRLLRSLGFTVYAVGARVNESGGFGGWYVDPLHGLLHALATARYHPILVRAAAELFSLPC